MTAYSQSTVSTEEEGICTIATHTGTTSSSLLDHVVAIALGSNPFVAAAIAGFVVWSVYMLWKTLHISYNMQLWYEYLFVSIPTITLPHLPRSVTEDDGVTMMAAAAAEPPASSSSQPGVPTLQDPKRPGMIQCYDPSTQQRLGEVIAMTAEQVHAACTKASWAQKEWAQTSFAQRRMVLRTLQKYIVTHCTEICRVSSRDSGKPIVDAYLGEILTTTEKIRTICACGELWLQPSYRSTGVMFCYKVPRVEYVPYGVIAPIAPWNYPFHNYMNHIISGIFAGNAVVGKVSEHTSWSAVTYYSQMVQAALIEHGHNPDLVQTITGFGPAGAALVTNPYVDKIIFTGSPEIGKKVMAAAAQTLTPVVLELGGKDAMVITEDVQIANVVPWVMRGCYQNGGQNCVGVERVLVYESMYQPFIDAIVPKVKALRQGIPLQTCGADGNVDCGSMVMDAQLQHVQTLIDDAVQCGAQVLVGGKRNAACSTGQFYEPTVIMDVTPRMRIFHEEVFGPVMTIIKVPDDDDATCVGLINDSTFGLSSSVFCNNQNRALRIGQQIRSGMCCTNDFGSNYLIQSLPFGGVRDSGFGRFAGIEGLRALCLERSIVTDRFPNFIRTSIPAAIDYPIDPKKGIPFAHSLIQLFYNESWMEKIYAIIGLIKYG
jgi:acyl-CoA reductase-like NAD-dependent aldehyde dehydrogenase